VISRGSNPWGVIVISSASKSAIGRVRCGKAGAGALLTAFGETAVADVEVRLAAITPARAASKAKALATIDTTARVLTKERFFLVDIKFLLAKRTLINPSGGSKADAAWRT
jgi:hypothetical protein